MTGKTNATVGILTLTGDAVVAHVLDGETFYNTDPETQETGTMPDNTAENVEVTDVDGTLIPVGYYDGTGSAVLSAAEAAKVIAGNILSGVTLLGVAGNANVVNTSSGDAVAGDLVADKKAWVDGAEVTGTMVDRGTVSTDISAKATEVTIAAGKHSGTGVVKIATVEQDKCIAGNIKSGVTLLGVEGTYESALTGDAVVGEVLDGKFFYKDAAATKLEGTMPNNAGDTAAVSAHMDTTSLHVIPAAGYYDGTDDAATVANIATTVITDGIVFKTRSTGRAATVDFYGTIVNMYQFYNHTGETWNALTDVTFKNALTQVGAYCFEDCTLLALTALPSTLTTLGNGSFQGCAALAITAIPSGIETMTGTCFKGCTTIASLSMPTIQTIVGGTTGTGSFDGCTGLNSATVGSSGHAVSGIGEFAFTGCGATGTLTIYTADGNALANTPYGWTGTVTHTQA